MPTTILMPSLSPTMEEGVIAKWLAKEGDLIKQGTLLCSVETDKTTVDYESLDEGYLRQILLPAGSAAKVNQLIAVLSEEKNEDIAEFLTKAKEKNAKQMEGKGGAKPAAASAPATPPPIPSAAPAASAPAIANPAPAYAAAATAAPTNGGRVFASPLAKKMATDKGIAIENLAGSGPSGRVIRRDIENYVPAAAKAAAPSAGKEPQVVQRPLFGSLAPIAPTADIPQSMMRKTIGKRLLESTQNIPVFYVTMKVEVDALNTLRNQLNRASGYKISVNDIVIKATAFALRQFPQVNSGYYGDFVRQNANIDISVAVSVDGGLITPIVKSPDLKGLGLISQEVKSLVGKAKAGKLAPEEYQGGTFTISNMGMYGVDEFTSIINPPQSAILAVAGIQDELYKEGDAILSRQVMKITLSADHRVIDGAMAAHFVSGLKSLLENPVWLML